MIEHRNEFTSSVPGTVAKKYHLVWTADKNIPLAPSQQMEWRLQTPSFLCSFLEYEITMGDFCYSVPGRFKKIVCVFPLGENTQFPARLRLHRPGDSGSRGHKHKVRKQNSSKMQSVKKTEETEEKHV